MTLVHRCKECLFVSHEDEGMNCRHEDAITLIEDLDTRMKYVKDYDRILVELLRRELLCPLFEGSDPWPSENKTPLPDKVDDPEPANYDPVVDTSDYVPIVGDRVVIKRTNDGADGSAIVGDYLLGMSGVVGSIDETTWLILHIGVTLDNYGFMLLPARCFDKES